MNDKVTSDEAQEAWFEFEGGCKRIGIQPSAFVAFREGYLAGKNAGIPQGTLDGYDAGFIAGQEANEPDPDLAEGRKVKAEAQAFLQANSSESA